jgi:hypothetical protein
MSTRTSQTPNHLPLLHRQEPIGKGLAWWRIISDSEPLRQRKTGHIGLKPGRLSYVIARQRGLLAGLEADPLFKSP